MVERIELMNQENKQKKNTRRTKYELDWVNYMCIKMVSDTFESSSSSTVLVAKNKKKKRRNNNKKFIKTNKFHIKYLILLRCKCDWESRFLQQKKNKTKPNIIFIIINKWKKKTKCQTSRELKQRKKIFNKARKSFTIQYRKIPSLKFIWFV